ncbi:vacuolar-sorting protein SNF8-like isoform X1 [Haliotis rubra]|uniref:vacuolar-sorting protein SNF8-like isoform X1 n=2 Tax=Haliotis rubra TaxID=36100 RepID=UPI001EE538EE|nr:vacuolar-sorting protein SNF8-like isoform X1 [Haliotis rubra]
MRRRGPGIAAIKNKNLAEARYKDKGSVLAEDQVVQMASQMEMFKKNLEDFATKHKGDIKKDPEFRLQFQEMCASIGVDPLASSKGFWAEMLGVGDFYYELGVQIVEVCLATSHRNGGLVSIEELRERVEASRGRHTQDISIDDLLRAIKKLKILGNGFTVIPMGTTFMIQSVPGELTMDHTTLLTQAQAKGYVTKSQLEKELKWEEERARRALDFMVKEGLAWVDDVPRGDRQFWFPSLFPACTAT